jgi:hypothetical protein
MESREFTQVAKHLLCKCKALSSNPISTKKKKKEIKREFHIIYPPTPPKKSLVALHQIQNQMRNPYMACQLFIIYLCPLL